MGLRHFMEETINLTQNFDSVLDKRQPPTKVFAIAGR